MFKIVLPLIARNKVIMRLNNRGRLNGGRELKYPATPVESSKPVCSDLMSGTYERILLAIPFIHYL